MNQKYISLRPIIIVANSSFYLVHYRKLLLNDLVKNNHIITISPTDKYTNELSKISIHLPWRINRSNDLNPASFIISFIRLIFLIRAIKPKLVHSHTLKSNLIVSIICFFYSIPCVISFTGLGRLSKSKKHNLIFKATLKTIIFFSLRKKNSNFKFHRDLNRSRLIFQNHKDKSYIESINNSVKSISKIIYGSGLPKEYFSSKKIKSFAWEDNNIDKTIPKIQFIFCARLLISKGIETFLKLADLFKEHEFLVYGEIDKSSKDSISESRLQTLSNKRNIYLKGYISNPLLNLDCSNPVLILPTYYGEGMPRGILEAFSLNVPIICSKSATCNIFSTENLYIAENENINEYKKKINELIADFKNGSLKDKLINSKNLSKIYSEEIIVGKTISIYKDILLENF